MNLTDQLIRVATGQYDIEVITNLALNHLDLVEVSRVAGCTALTNLNVAHNRIVSVAGLQPIVANLTRLDVSHNALVTFDIGNVALQKLEVLHLEGNNISDLEGLCTTLSAAPRLRSLYLQDKDGGSANPLCLSKEYPAVLLKRFPSLRCLDGNYFLKEGVGPRYVQMGNDDEFKLPPTQPWVTETFFASALYDPQKVGAFQEKNFRAVLAETRTLVQSTQ